MQSKAAVPDVDLTRQREVVEAFLAASRRGDSTSLLAVLDPNVVTRADRAAVRLEAVREVHGASDVAKQALIFARLSRLAQLALMNGAVGDFMAPRGRLFMVLAFEFTDQKIVPVDMIADPACLSRIDLAALDG